MKAVILGLPHGEFDEDVELETDTSQRIPALVVEETQYLDGVSIYHGTAAGRVKTNRSSVYVDTDNDRISTEREEILQEVATDFYADFDAGFVGVDTSDGEFLWKLLGPKAGAVIVRAQIKLDAFAENYERQDDASCWQIGYKPDDDNVGVRYHDDARVHTRGVTQLGFEYWWDGQLVRGTVAASGYVAVYSNMAVETFGRWLRVEILPFASLPDEDAQESLDDVEQDTTDDEEGSASSEDGNTTLDDLQTVEVTDGGRDE
jgi:hypothetical protein